MTKGRGGVAHNSVNPIWRSRYMTLRLEIAAGSFIDDRRDNSDNINIRVRVKHNIIIIVFRVVYNDVKEKEKIHEKSFD